MKLLKQSTWLNQFVSFIRRIQFVSFIVYFNLYFLSAFRETWFIIVWKLKVTNNILLDFFFVFFSVFLALNFQATSKLHYIVFAFAIPSFFIIFKIVMKISFCHFFVLGTAFVSCLISAFTKSFLLLQSTLRFQSLLFLFALLFYIFLDI